MKKIILLTAPLFFYATTFFAQAKVERNCEIENIELITLDRNIPQSEVISKYNTIRINRTITDISELTKRETKLLKKKARRNSSCKIYIDFENKLFEKDNIYLQENNEIVYVFTKDKL
ncbi:MAG: hypothetical protein N4A35_09095 [Flavobacteriales bacterium]|jgi:hypothetical protein|nr:hypothetical protein [Flavobacteriales bacterium]